jgi:hypothetical protein
MSVMVISRLLKVAEMWATPSDSTTLRARLAAGALGATGVVIGYFFVAFFLPAIARRGPFLVRALV